LEKPQQLRWCKSSQRFASSSHNPFVVVPVFSLVTNSEYRCFPVRDA
jgi:hypothetical protein